MTPKAKRRVFVRVRCKRKLENGIHGLSTKDRIEYIWTTLTKFRYSFHCWTVVYCKELEGKTVTFDAFVTVFACKKKTHKKFNKLKLNRVLEKLNYAVRIMSELTACKHTNRTRSWDSQHSPVFQDLLSYPLFMARQPPMGPGPHHSRGF